jgi:hypothetical protein
MIGDKVHGECWFVVGLRIGREEQERSEGHSTVWDRVHGFARNKKCVGAAKIQLPYHVSVHRIAVVVDMCLTVETARVERTGPWWHVSTVGNSLFTAQA